MACRRLRLLPLVKLHAADQDFLDKSALPSSLQEVRQDFGGVAEARSSKGACDASTSLPEPVGSTLMTKGQLGVHVALFTNFHLHVQQKQAEAAAWAADDGSALAANGAHVRCGLRGAVAVRECVAEGAYADGAQSERSAPYLPLEGSASTQHVDALEVIAFELDATS